MKIENSQFTTAVEGRYLWIGAIFLLLLEVLGLLLLDRFSTDLVLAGLAAGVLILAVLLQPFNGILIFLAVEFSGLVWGLEIPNGFVMVVGLATLAWLFERTVTLDWTFRFSPIYFFLLAFLAVCLASGYSAVKLETVFEQFFVYVQLSFMLFLVFQFLHSEKRIIQAVDTLIFALLFAIVIGLLVFFVPIPFLTASEPGFRFRGLGIDPNIVATQILIVFPVIVLRLFYERRLWKKILLGFLLILFTFALFATFSRSAVLGLGVSVLSLLFVLRRNRKLLIAAFVLTIVGLFFVPDMVWERLQTLGEATKDPSLRWRARMYVLAFDKFVENPILGIGIGNFINISHMVTNQHLRVHGTFLELATETGLIGFSVYLGMLIYLMGRLKKCKDRLFQEGRFQLYVISQGLLVAFLTVLVIAQFISMQWFVSLWILMAIAVAIVELPEREEPHGRP